MNLPLRIGYEGAAHLARALAAIAPSSRRKLVQTFAARRGVGARYAAFTRPRDRPLLWMHAPSVGEGLQARPVLELFREREPDTLLAYTYFSPSAERFAQALDVDFRDVLPFDTGGDARRTLIALSPTALVFSKLDVWPTLVREASRQQVQLGLVSATLAAGSSRMGGFAAALLRDAYARLDRVGAISADDAERLVALGVSASAISVTGDTRFDQVWARAAGVDRDGQLLAPLREGRATLVAGSTWPSDERPLLEAWGHVRSRIPDARLIIAPHEPTPAHVASLMRWGMASGLRSATLGDGAESTAELVVVNRVGVLGDLYALADVAYVGGGFHAAGLHSVLEPAAFGAPVLFGPRHANSRDARLLLDAGAAASGHDARSLARVLVGWLGDAASGSGAGDAARAIVREGLGAAQRSYDLVRELML
ncbi:MAG: glycosyltransferase N-terminal domain-containing protein [Gemmatimonadaceae bacterium]